MSNHVDELFERHAREILAFAFRRASDRQAAEDVVAETFSIAWRRRKAIPEPELPWLYSVALNVLSNQRRSTRRRLSLRKRIEQQPVVFGRDPAELVERSDEIRSAFALLGESQREVLRLAFWEDLNTHDAASVLGCTEGAYRVRLHRARQELAKHLESAGQVADEAPRSVNRLADSTSQEGS